MSFLIATNEGGNFNLSLSDGGNLPVQSTGTIGPGSGPTPATAQTAWFQSYATGNNANDGKTAATAVQTAAEIKRRWTGGVNGARVQLPGVTITITALDNVPANTFTDPWSVLLDVDQLSPGQLLIQGATLAPSHTGTIATASAFARTSAAGQIVITAADAPDWHALGTPNLFVDTTGNGVGWLYEPQSTPSANGTISPLRGPAVPATTADGGQVTVHAADAYQLVPLVQLYMGAGAKYRDFPAQVGGLSVSATIRRVHWIRSGSFEIMRIEPQDFAAVYWQECQLDPELNAVDGTIVQNCWSTTFILCSQKSSQNNPLLYSGGTYGAVSMGAGAVIVDRDYVLDTVNGGTAFFFARGSTAFLRIGQASCWGLTTAGQPTTGNLIRIGGINGSGDVFYGKVGANPIFNMASNSILAAFGTGTVASALNFDSATLAMSGGANAFGFDLTTGLYVGPTTLTIAHLDAALAAGTGFGGFALDPRLGTQINSATG